MSIEEVIKKYSKYINIELPEVYYTTSFPSLNRAIGGIKGGRFLQLIGYEKAGKTTLACDIIKNAQNNGHMCAFVDIERTFDPEYAELLGVNVESLLMIYPDTTETAMSIVEALVLSGDVKVIVIDSIPAMLPKAELEKDYDDSEKIAAAAGALTRFIKRMTPILSNYGALLILINQWRSNLSPMARSEKKPYGATSLRYATGLKLELTRVENDRGKARVQVLVEKDKQGGTEGEKIDLWLKHGYGFDREEDILNLAIEYGIITMSGKTWMYYGDLKAQGRDNAKTQFPMDEIAVKVLHKMKGE